MVLEASEQMACAHFSAHKKEMAVLALKYVYRKSHSFFPFKSWRHGKCIFKPRLQICVLVYTPTLAVQMALKPVPRQT